MREMQQVEYRGNQESFVSLSKRFLKENVCQDGGWCDWYQKHAQAPLVEEEDGLACVFFPVQRFRSNWGEGHPLR